MKAKHWMTIEFLRDAKFPRFSMRAGERWTFPVCGKLVSRAEAIRSGNPDARFEFADGECMVRDVRIVYDGESRAEAYLAGGIVDSDPNLGRCAQMLGQSGA